MKKILGLGNALVDVLAPLQTDELLKEMELPKGSMQLIDEQRRTRIETRFASLKTQRATGGSAGNAMLALANLGMEPGFVGMVGHDAVGDFFAENCRAKGIHPHLLHGKQPSGIAYTFISPDGERTFGTYLGAAGAMEPENLTDELFEGYDYLYVEGYLVQNHGLMRKAMELARRAGMKICLDLASYNIVEADLDFFTKMVRDSVDIVFANEEEARAFAGCEPQEALSYMAAMCEVAVVKLGANGSVLMRGDECCRAQSLPVQRVVDTTGAGDYYAAGVMYGILQGYSMDRCAAIGSLLAGEVIQTVGTTVRPEVWHEIKLRIKQIENA